MPNPLRVLVDARMVTSQIHGIGRYTINLIRGLASRGHRIGILFERDETPNVIGLRELSEKIQCRTPFAHPREVLELSTKSRQGNYDIVHFPSFAVPWSLPPRTVITLHDLIHLRTGSPAHHLYYQTVVRRALSRCSRIITVSEWTKEDLQKKLKTPAAKIEVVRNGLEDGWFDLEAAVPAPTGVAKPYFLCLSNPKPHKNVQTLVAACQTLWDRGRDFHLVLSLGGSEIPGSWNLSADSREKIFLLKNIEDYELPPYYRHAVALVSPSLYEGFDYPAAEGLALGKTVILSEGSAHSEIQSSNARFYGPAKNVSALAEALLKILERKEAETTGLNNIDRLTAMIDGTLKVYQTVLSGGI